MNAKKLIYTSVALLGLGAFSSCSDNYLDLAPVTSVTNNSATATVDGAKLAMIGICQAMCQQYQEIGGSNGYNFMNGEAYVNHRMNDAFGPDQHNGIGMLMWGYDQITQSVDTWGRDNYVINYIVWKYCYNLIQQANVILDGIDDAEGDATQRDFIKAQVLTIRAHAYTKLVQYYAPRWENSNNGNVYCLVMRDHYTTEGAPLCTMNDALNLVYSDLDNAIELYQSTGMKREEKWMPDMSVAYGIYARAAMVKHDYATAQTMAHNAYQGYTILDNKTLFSGLFEDNNDYMWISTTDGTDLYYWSELCLYATNGVYTKNWQTPDAIDLDLYNQMAENDVRRGLFLMPDKIEYLNGLNQKTYNPANLTEAAFWNPVLVNVTNNCDLNNGEIKKSNNPWGMKNLAAYFSWVYYSDTFTGNKDLIYDTEQKNIDYLTLDGKGDFRVTSTQYITLNTIPFGAQFKFWAVAPYSAGAQSWMRSTEFRFLEAEAAYYNGDEGTCRANLNEIQGMRIPGYSFNGSGQALLDELRLAYRIETWGEGHNWTDYKRWNLPIVRRAWQPNDPTSGNWQTEFGIDTPVDRNSGWRMRLPYAEYNYNKEIDRELLEQSYN